MSETIIICITAVLCCLITVGGINRSVWWMAQTIIRLREVEEARQDKKKKMIDILKRE